MNNTQVDNAKDLDVVMTVYNLIKCSDNYSKTAGHLWLSYRNESALNDNGNVIDFTDNTDSLKKTDRTGNNDIKNVEIMVPLKYVSKSWRTLEMPLIN